MRFKGTHQGYCDDSTWARGQSWAVYGFAMAYRYERDTRFLEVARRAADYFIESLPADGVPYWDFELPDPGAGTPKEAGSEVDVGHIYADYYFLEAVLRLQEPDRRLSAGVGTS